MKQQRGSKLRRMIELCTDLQRLRTKMSDPDLARDTRTRLRRQSRRKVDQLTRDLAGYRFRSPLAEIMRSYRLKPAHFEVLALLLQRHMSSEDPSVEGRLILSSLYESSFEVLAGMDILQSTSPLRTGGLVELEDDDDQDLLEARFRLSEEALEAFRGEVTGLVPEDLRRRRNRPYASNREFLIDLRVLHNLHKSRSERLFRQDQWERLHIESGTPGNSYSRRIQAFWKKIQERLRASDHAVEFPAVRFMREQGISIEEMVCVIHLLFQELYEGNAYTDVVALLKLVSQNEDELIRNRRLFQPESKLIRNEILAVEPMLEGRVLTAEAHLNDWVVNFVCGSSMGESIQPDERLDWHLYLQDLRDTNSFYRDLEAN